MNFENYKGKRIRLTTNILDDYGQYKIVEGVLEDFANLGSKEYIIVDGQAYPEMCITNFGLVPEKVMTKIEDDTAMEVEDEYIPAQVIQVDPLDIINGKIDELEPEAIEVKKTFWNRFDSGIVVKGVTLLFMLIVCSIINTGYNHYIADTPKDTLKSEFVYQPTLGMMDKSCTIINGTQCCNGKIAYSRAGVEEVCNSL